MISELKIGKVSKFVATSILLWAYLDSGLFYYSDNYPFFEEFQVPCHTLVSFDFDNYDHYHKVSDEIIKLDVENMNSIIHTSTFIISQLLENKIELINH